MFYLIGVLIDFLFSYVCLLRGVIKMLDVLWVFYIDFFKVVIELCY